MKDRNIGAARHGVIVDTDGKLQWSGKERNIAKNWGRGTYWGSAPDKQSALKMAMRYVESYWKTVGL